MNPSPAEEGGADVPQVQAPATPPRAPSTAVLVLAFVAIALLGALLFSLVAPPPAAGARGPAAEAPADRGESATEIANRLREDANTLAAMIGELKQRIAAQDEIITERNRETVAALAEQKRLQDANAQLRADRDAALGDAALAQTFKREADAAKATIDDLRAQLARLGAEPDELRRQLGEAERLRRELEARVASLESQLNQSRLFAGTEDQILREAIALFRALRELEGQSDSEIATAYSAFGARLGAQVLKTCNFPTGSAEVPPELEAGIRELPAEVPDRSLIFVVGYASETGNVDGNRRLSSERATAVARVLDSTKRPGQNVQAAYLGQTDRFSSRIPERNQIVEIWQIVAKPGTNGLPASPVPPPPAPGDPR